MKILIIGNYVTLPWDKGSGRLTTLAEMFADRGHEVTLMTSTFCHRNKKQRDEAFLRDHDHHYYRIELLYEKGYKNHFGAGRAMSHWSFGKRVARRLQQMEVLPDLIYYSFPTFSTAYAASSFAKRHGIPAIIDVIDIWPEALQSVLKIPERCFNLVFSLFTFRANEIYKNADAIVGVSQTYTDRAKRVSKRKPVKTIYLGSELTYFDQCPYKRIKAKNEIWLVYIGTISYSYDLVTLIKAVQMLVKKYPYLPVKAKIVGDGPHLNRLKKLALREQLPVTFTGFVTYPEMVNYLKNADIAVNAIAKGARQSITYKIGDYVSAGLPILNGSENPEFIRLVREEEIGINYETGNALDLSEKIADLINNKEKMLRFGQRSRRFAEARFNRKVTYNTIISLVESMVETKEKEQPVFMETTSKAFAQ